MTLALPDSTISHAISRDWRAIALAVGQLACAPRVVTITLRRVLKQSKNDRVRLVYSWACMAEEKCIVLHLHEATVEGCMEAICEIFYMRVCVIRDQFSR